MNLLKSGPIALSDVTSDTIKLYVQVVLAGGSADGTCKSAEITASFSGTEATVSSTVTFAKMV